MDFKNIRLFETDIITVLIYITIVIYCAKQYANFISALAELCETYRDHSLAVSIETFFIRKSFLASIYSIYNY